MDEPSSQCRDDAALTEPGKVAELLDGVAGAYERAQLGLLEAEAGETIPLDEL